MRPGLRPRVVAVTDEVVLHGGGEVFRVPLSQEAVARHAVLVRALPVLRAKVPVPVAVPRYAGVLEDGATPFAAERRLPGVGLPDGPLPAVAASQLAGVLAALADVPAREAAQWGVRGEGGLRHGALSAATVLHDPARGVLTGLVGWRPRLAPGPEDLSGLPLPVAEQVAAALARAGEAGRRVVRG